MSALHRKGKRKAKKVGQVGTFRESWRTRTEKLPFPGTLSHSIESRKSKQRKYSSDSSSPEGALSRSAASRKRSVLKSDVREADPEAITIVESDSEHENGNLSGYKQKNRFKSASYGELKGEGRTSGAKSASQGHARHRKSSILSPPHHFESDSEAFSFRETPNVMRKSHMHKARNGNSVVGSRGKGSRDSFQRNQVRPSTQTAPSAFPRTFIHFFQNSNSSEDSPPSPHVEKRKTKPKSRSLGSPLRVGVSQSLVSQSSQKRDHLQGHMVKRTRPLQSEFHVSAPRKNCSTGNLFDFVTFPLKHARLRFTVEVDGESHQKELKFSAQTSEFYVKNQPNVLFVLSLPSCRGEWKIPHSEVLSIECSTRAQEERHGVVVLVLKLRDNFPMIGKPINLQSTLQEVTLVFDAMDPVVQKYRRKPKEMFHLSTGEVLNNTFGFLGFEGVSKEKGTKLDRSEKSDANSRSQERNVEDHTGERTMEVLKSQGTDSSSDTEEEKDESQQSNANFEVHQPPNDKESNNMLSKDGEMSTTTDERHGSRGLISRPSSPLTLDDVMNDSTESQFSRGDQNREGGKYKKHVKHGELESIKTIGRTADKDPPVEWHLADEEDKNSMSERDDSRESALQTPSHSATKSSLEKSECSLSNLRSERLVKSADTLRTSRRMVSASSSSTPSSTRSSSRIARGKRKSYDVDNQEIITQYPIAGGKGVVVIRREDLARCEPGEFLNDSLIDLFLKRDLQEIFPQQVADKVHLFNCFFYKKLTEVDRSKSSGLKTKARHVANFGNVHRWTRNIDIFSKKYILVPVNASLHWSLAIICNPGVLVNNPSSSNRGDSPCIIMMDSLQCHPSGKIARYLRSYLNFEVKRQREGVEADLSSLSANDCIFDQASMPIVTPKLPTQSNSCDCGVFLLEYANRFFRNCGDESFQVTYSAIQKKLRRWFTPNMFDSGHIRRMRVRMKRLIQKLSDAYHKQGLANTKEASDDDDDVVEYVTSSGKPIHNNPIHNPTKGVRLGTMGDDRPRSRRTEGETTAPKRDRRGSPQTRQREQTPKSHAVANAAIKRMKHMKKQRKEQDPFKAFVNKAKPQVMNSGRGTAWKTSQKRNAVNRNGLNGIHLNDVKVPLKKYP